MSTLLCPTCTYDLTGLPEGTCPECGTGFTHSGLEALEQLNLTRAAKRRDAIVIAIASLLGLPMTCFCVGNTPELLVLLVPGSLIVLVCYLVVFRPLVARWLVLLPVIPASIYGASLTMQGVHRSFVGFRFTDHDWSNRTPITAHEALWLGPAYLLGAAVVTVGTWKLAAWRKRQLDKSGDMAASGSSTKAA
jgi:uncharacterized protein (DUF983 family)